ncbi:Glycine receptor subunit beta-type 4 [Aphelenchoides besseyi]|nr:Glycine receptor subunit beta-type 4 [Aphelenchoides besseyi]
MELRQLISIWVILSSIDCSKSPYEKLKQIPLPFDRSEEATVRVGLYIESLGKFLSTEMSFDVDLYVYLHWRDPSLKHSMDDYRLILNISEFQTIWKPDLYLANSRSSKWHDLLLPNFSIFVDRDGNIGFSSRYTATISCNFDLRLFPLDTQECHFQIISYAHTADKLRVLWFDNEPIRYHQEIGLPEFTLQSITPSYCNGTYRYAITEESYKEGVFNCLQTNIQLKRSVAVHLIESYFPSAIIVMISWILFWIDRRAIHARLTLWFTILLSLFTVGNTVRSNLPPVSVIKALDVWIGVCIFMIICALVEIVVCNIFVRRADRHEKMAQTMSFYASKPQPPFSTSFRRRSSVDNLTLSYYEENETHLQVHNSPRIQELKIGYECTRKAFQIDRLSRVVFPTCFSAFSLLYWLFYLLQAK